MFDLIRKDLLCNKRGLSTAAVVCTAFFVWAATTLPSANMFLVVVALMMGLMPPLNILGQEDKFNTYLLSCSLPVRRADFVLAKYAVSWLLAGVGLLYALTVTALLPFSHFSISVLLTPTMLLNFLFFTALVIALLIPFLLRFGVMGIMIFLLAVQLLGVAMTLVVSLFGARRNVLRTFIQALKGGIRFLLHHPGSPLFFLGMIAAVVVVSFVSLKISQAVFSRRDL